MIIRSRNHGVSAGFNIGFACSNPASEYLIKLDSDIVLKTPGWLPRFHRFFKRNPNTGLLALTQINHARLRFAPQLHLAGEWVSSLNHWVCGGACMTIPRAIFERVGYFREDFAVPYFLDDVDYANRLSFLGKSAYYLQGCRAYHRGDLDHGPYRSYHLDKRRQMKQNPWKRTESEIMHALAVGDGLVPLSYEHYAKFRFPEGRRVIEVE